MACVSEPGSSIQPVAISYEALAKDHSPIEFIFRHSSAVEMDWPCGAVQDVVGGIVNCNI